MLNNVVDSGQGLKLRKFSEEHLYYEISMLYDVTFRLSTRISDRLIANTMVESFGTHATLLLDFLFNIKEKDDDSIADDYLIDLLAWRKLSSSHRKKFDFVWQRRNKELAHLSYARLGITIQEKQWHFVAITREISNLIDFFIDSANKDLLHEKVIKLKGVFRNHPMWQIVPNFSSAPMNNIGTH